MFIPSTDATSTRGFNALNTYIAESKVDGVEFAHQFKAHTHDEAQLISDRMGWTFLGQAFSEMEIEAQIESRLFRPRMH